MKFLLGAHPHNAQFQGIARALHEAGGLGAFHTAGLANNGWGLLSRLAGVAPRLAARLDRRRVTAVPPQLVHTEWRSEFARALARHLRLHDALIDWLWERGELAADRRWARLMRRDRFDAFIGAEHGALTSLTASRQHGKPGVVVFTSPHHSFRKRWVDEEYRRAPALLTPSAERLRQLAQRRDARRDAEASVADAIIVNSRLTARSLVEAGVEAGKILVIPCGAPSAPYYEADTQSVRPQRFVYAGVLAPHKGVLLLLRAWERVGAGSSAELHLYGQNTLPSEFTATLPRGVRLRGLVPMPQLHMAFRRSSALVFPTLCDGFGSVVLEALANGLPVITTRNAGCAELLTHGVDGFVIEPGDVDALAERLDWCLQRPQELRGMRPHASATARRWPWARFRETLRAELGRVFGISWTEPRAMSSRVA